MRGFLPEKLREKQCPWSGRQQSHLVLPWQPGIFP